MPGGVQGKVVTESIIDTHGFARRLKFAREERGLGVNELARLADIAASSLSRMENKQYVGVTLPTVVKLSMALDVSIDWLVLGRGAEPSSRMAK